MTTIPPLFAPARSRIRQRLSSGSARDVTSTATVNVSVTLLTSVGGVILARQLGAADRGFLVTVLIWPAAMGGVASLGITQSACYWISRRRDEGVAIMNAAARAALLTGAAVGVVGFIVAPLIGRTELVTSLLRVVLALSPLFIAGGVWMSSLQAVDIAAWNRARIVQPVAYFTGVLGLALTGRLTLTTASTAFCVSLVVQTWHARRRARQAVEGAAASTGKLYSTLYRYGAKVSAATLPRLINMRLDQLVLSVLPAIAASELGIYAVATSLSWLALPAAAAFGSIAFPAVAGSTLETRTRRIERMSLLGSASVAAAVLLVVCLAAPFVVPRLFGRDFGAAVACLWLLAPGTICLAVNGVLAAVLQGRGRPLSTSFGEGAAAVVTVVLLLALTPHFGIRGAAAASSVAYLSATIVLCTRLKAARGDGMMQDIGSSA